MKMTSVACIVEGHGEVAAMPILLRRLVSWLSPGRYVDVLMPIRVPRDRFLRNTAEFERMLRLAANKCTEAGWILVVLDADDDCPMTLAAMILNRAAAVVPTHRISVVIANREYEAWFIAAAASLATFRKCGLPDRIPDAESRRNPKRWVETELMDGVYGETTDQPRLTAAMDLSQALQHSRSFRKLFEEVEANLCGADHGPA